MYIQSNSILLFPFINIINIHCYQLFFLLYEKKSLDLLALNSITSIEAALIHRFIHKFELKNRSHKIEMSRIFANSVASPV